MSPERAPWLCRFGIHLGRTVLRLDPLAVNARTAKRTRHCGRCGAWLR